MSILVGATSACAGAAGASAGGAADLGATISQGLRFISANSTKLSKTLGTPTDRDKWSWSCWVKKAKFDEPGRQVLFGGFSSATNNDWLEIGYEHTNELYYTSSGLTATSPGKYRDPSAWQHVAATWDGSNLKIYSNGVRVINDTQLSGNVGINAAASHVIGQTPSTSHSRPFNGYICEMNFLDGTLIGETTTDGEEIIDEFGRYNENGIWVPKAIDFTSDQYGNNGFRLTFDSSAGGGLGDDSAPTGGNHDGANDFTASGFETTAISSSNFDNDIDYNDTPTSNYATFNPVTGTGASTSANTSDSSLTLRGGAGATITEKPSSKTIYFELQTGFVNNGRSWSNWWNVIHVLNGPTEAIDGGGSGVPPSNVTSQGGFAFDISANVFANNTNQQVEISSTNLAADDIIGVQISDSHITIYINGTASSGVNNLALGNSYNDGMYIYARNAAGASNPSEFLHINFGQRPFIHQPSALSNSNDLQTNNLPEPTIKNGKEHFGILTYTAPSSPSYPITINGSGGNNGTGELDFDAKPDLVWIKMRNGTQNHTLFDAVRGNAKSLRTDENIAEANRTNFDFATDGFTFSAADAETYQQNDQYVAWCWKAGGTPSVTYTVKVVSDSGNKYRFDDFGTSAVTLDLEEGGTYVFDQSDSSNSGHPLRFSTTSDGTHGGGSEYTTGVTTAGTPGSAGAKTTITVASGAATLHYYCSVHSGMGGQANTNDTKGSSNFSGTIQSKVTTNTDAGFSIISFTGNETASTTIGHGLSQAPEFVITKKKDNAGNWNTFHASAGSTKYLVLNLADMAFTDSSMYNGTTSTVVNIGHYNAINANNEGMMMYAWHSVEGYSKFGEYTGNGSGSSPNADGAFVYLGFKPALVIIKRTDTSSGGEWSNYDSTRSSTNANRAVLSANNAMAETTMDGLDLLSNGFKVRGGSGTWVNVSGGSYVYMAWAEHPFGGENAPPATAR